MVGVIVAGGKGTRLGSVTRLIPKPMIPIGTKPVLEHQIRLLQKAGIQKIYILVNYRSENIIEYFTNGSNFGVQIEYVTEDVPLGTAGSIFYLHQFIHENFLLLYGDVMVNFDIEAFIEFHNGKRGDHQSLVVHPNTHPFDSDLIECDGNNLITSFHSKPHEKHLYYLNLVNAGIYILSPRVFDFIKKDTFADFGKDIFPSMVNAGVSLFAYNSAEYFKDMGTPQRLQEVNDDFYSGKVERLHKKKKRKAIFIDRDGVLIKQVDQLVDIDLVTLLPSASEAIRLINDTEYLVIMITNQPMIAKGTLTFNSLQQIHNKIETLLGNNEAKLDAIYFCPHHPDKGFLGEVIEYKTQCECRKPRIGLIEQAQKDFNIDLHNSYFIGDSTTDLLTAQNAHLQSILVQTGFAGKDKVYDVKPDHIASDLLDAVESIIHDEPCSLL